MEALLRQRDWVQLEAWAREARNPAGPLLQALFSPEELLRWRAIEGLGVVAGTLPLEAVRELLRRAVWFTNDESGALLWNAPEVMAEILVHVPELISEFAKLLPTLLERSPFERGAAWAMARLAPLEPGVLRPQLRAIQAGLDHEDPYVRAHCALALESLGRESGDWRQDQATLSVYDRSTGRLSQTTAAQLAEAWAALV